MHFLILAFLYTNKVNIFESAFSIYIMKGGSFMPTAFTSAASAVWTSVGDAITVITGNAVLLLPVAIGFTGAVVGIVRRMTKIGSGRRK